MHGKKTIKRKGRVQNLGSEMKKISGERKEQEYRKEKGLTAEERKRMTEGKNDRAHETRKGK